MSVQVRFSEDTLRAIQEQGLDVAEIQSKAAAAIAQESFRSQLRKLIQKHGTTDFVIEVDKEGVPTIYSGIPSLMIGAYGVGKRRTVYRGAKTNEQQLRKDVEDVAFVGDGYKRNAKIPPHNTDETVLHILQTDTKKYGDRYKDLELYQVKNALNWLRCHKKHRRAPSSKYWKDPQCN